MDLQICGLVELATWKDPFTHLISIIEPSLVASLPKLNVPAERRLLLTCDDVEWPAPFTSRSAGPPSEDMVRQALAFARRLLPEDRLLVHCRHGISRSTALAFVLLCDAHPAMPEREVLRKVVAMRPMALPNSLIVSLGDKILNRNGRMIAALSAYRRDPEGFMTSAG